VLGSGQKLLHQLRVGTVGGVDVDMALHPLKANRDGAIDEQCPSNIHVSRDIYLKRGQCDSQTLSDHANGRIQADGEGSAEHVSGVRSVVMPADGAVNAKVPRNTVVFTAGHDVAVKGIGIGTSRGSCSVGDRCLIRGVLVPLTKRILPVAYA
jgi:hypothetical protein